MYLSISLRILKSGIPIGIPSFLASAERDITHPSLLESTTSGESARSGLKTFSQEAKKLLQSISPIILLLMVALIRLIKIAVI